MARSASRLPKLRTGRLSSVRLVAALAVPAGSGRRGRQGLPGGLGGGLVVGEQDGRKPGLHVPGDVVRQHPHEHVGADPVFDAGGGWGGCPRRKARKARSTWASAL
jgi:hypothetical protein